MIKSAIVIQSLFRGIRARVEYGHQIKARIIAKTRAKFSKNLESEAVCAKTRGFELLVTWCGPDFSAIYLSGWSRFLDDAQIVSCGKFHTISYKHPNVCTLGVNYNGCLGIDSKVASVPHEIFTISPSLKVTSISCGELHTLLLLNTGILLGWGDNKYSQVFGSAASVPKPVMIPFYNPIVTIDTGKYHNAVIDMVGNVFLWGKGSYLGLKSNITRPTMLPQFGNILKFKYSRGDVVKAVVAEEVIFLLDSRNNLRSASKYGHRKIAVGLPVDNVWAYHNTAVILACGKLFHVNHRKVIDNSPFNHIFNMFNNRERAINEGKNDIIKHISVGYHELVIYNEDEMIILKEEGIMERIECKKNKINAIKSVKSCTIAATLMYN